MASALGDDDLWCLDDTMSDFRTVSGRVALAQALVRRWITERGELLDDPSYGTDLTDFLNSDLDRRELGQFVSIATAEALKDERVLAISGSAELTDTGVLNATFIVTDAAGPFELTIGIDDVTVELLTVQE